MQTIGITAARAHAFVATLVCGLGLVTAWVLTGEIAQDPAYHLFADRRLLLSIPHAHNVLSNLPFALVGALGLATLSSRRGEARETRIMYLVFFASVFLTAIGSAYYHLGPNNLTLLWDRLPMAVGFTSILAAIVSERCGPRTGRRLFPWLLFAGFASVVYWHWFDDLRLYALVQFGSLLALTVILLWRREPDSGLLWFALGFYLLAKIFETADAAIFELSGHLVSGHALKHVTAAAAPLLVWLRLLKAEAQDAGRLTAYPSYPGQLETRS